MTAKRVGLLILSVLLSLFFAAQGIVKLTGSATWIRRFHGWGYPDHFYLIVGAAELLGAILIVIPKTRMPGALLLIAVMAGAAATHLLHREPQIATALILCLLLAPIAFSGRPR